MLFFIVCCFFCVCHYSLFSVPYCNASPICLWYSSVSFSCRSAHCSQLRRWGSRRQCQSLSSQGVFCAWVKKPNRASAWVLMGLSDRCVWVWMCVHERERETEKRKTGRGEREWLRVRYNLWKAQNCSQSSNHDAMAHLLKLVISVQPCCFNTSSWGKLQHALCMRLYGCVTYAAHSSQKDLWGIHTGC